MPEELPIVELGDELAVVLPDHLLAKMGVSAGDTLWLDEKSYGFDLLTSAPDTSKPTK